MSCIGTVLTHKQQQLTPMQLSLDNKPDEHEWKIRIKIMNEPLRIVSLSVKNLLLSVYQCKI